MGFDETFDVVVVGAGTAGCVIARRLVDRGDCRVLLLEAGGPDERAAIHDTDIGSMTSLWGDPTAVWPHQTTAQHALRGRTVAIPQGRVLGGGLVPGAVRLSSAICRLLDDSTAL